VISNAYLIHIISLYIDIDNDNGVDIFLNCNWVDTRWQ